MDLFIPHKNDRISSVMKNTRKCKAIIFDLDGTLLDTLEDIADATNFALRSLGFPEHSLKNFHSFVGAGPHVLAEQVLPRKKRTKQTAKKVLALLDKYYSKHWHEKTRPYAGIFRLLSNLETSGIVLCVLSNKHQGFVRKMVRHFFPDHKFRVIMGYLPNRPAKPHPGTALDISSRIGCSPSDIIFLGDSDIDIFTARAAGMFAVGALWGFRTRKELVSAGADKLIRRPSALLSLIK